MSDDVDTIRQALEAPQAIYASPIAQEAALAAFGRVVAERDELRARLAQTSEWHHRAEQGWADEHARAEQALGNAFGASSTALISAERARQITAEGWTAEHDDRHSRGSLAEAAACYARPKREMIEEWDDDEDRAVMVPVGWPWEPRFWRPTPDDRVRELVKAGALIAAEIDRLLRVAEVSGGTSTGSARPPQPESETDALVRERLRMHAERQRAEAAEARVVLLEEALRGLLGMYVSLVGSGDCGHWDPEEDPEVIAARAALVGDAPPPNTKTGAGAPPAHVETGGPSGDSE